MTKKPKGDDPHRRPDVDPEIEHLYQPAKRKCLRCSQMFDSSWSGERICSSCR